MTQYAINLVFALACEAKPLIDFYRLAKQHNRPYDYFQGEITLENGESAALNLMVAGVGGLNQSTAVGWLAAKTDKQSCVWLNLGTAGHETYDIGEVVRVSKVLSLDSGADQAIYPPLIAKWQYKNAAIISYSEPCYNYPQAVMVDMEAANFFSTASRFASLELVQSIKVISDNKQQTVERLNAALISEIMLSGVEKIDGYIKQLLGLLQSLPDNRLDLSLIEHLHVTVSQQQQFKELVSKLTALGKLSPDLLKQISNSQSIKQVLELLRSNLDAAQPVLP